MPFDLVPLWTILLGLAVFYYVVFDGFDLGVGMLYGLARGDTARATVMNSIAPVWDGNETWLIFGGLGLLTAFPLAFAIIIPAVYFPILMMLLALVFRGVAFEFRFKHTALRRFWDAAFCGGSLVATFAQGVVLGTFIEGFKVDGRQSLAHPEIARRWFSWPNIALLSPVPIATALIALGEWEALRRRHEFTPFLGAIALFLMSFVGIAISLWPMIVPYRYTLWQAASSPSTQAFLLIGTLFLLPVILMYTAWSYWVFRGKARSTIGYH